jgi:hypothetical protein
MIYPLPMKYQRSELSADAGVLATHAVPFQVAI